MTTPTDEQVLRHAVESIFEVDLTSEHGWLEGTSYHDAAAGQTLVTRSVMVCKGQHGVNARLYLSESAVMRALRVAIDAAVADLLASDPPVEAIPYDFSDVEDMDSSEAPSRLIMLRGIPTVR